MGILFRLQVGSHISEGFNERGKSHECGHLSLPLLCSAAKTTPPLDFPGIRISLSEITRVQVHVDQECVEHISEVFECAREMDSDGPKSSRRWLGELSKGH